MSSISKEMQDLNIISPYGILVDEMALTVKEIGEEGTSQSSLPTNSDPSHPPIKKIGYYWHFELVCDICNKKFYRNVRTKIKSCGVYCSDGCRRGTLTLECGTCKKPVSVILSKYRNSTTKNFFCNPECYRRFRKIINYCGWCGGVINKTVHPTQSKVNFCSHECYSNWASETRKGDKSHLWKGGVTAYDYGENWKLQSRKAKRRDDYTCQRCGLKHSKYDRNLHAHHIKPFRFFGIEKYLEANVLDNLISLCYKCHRIVEAELDD